ncbi:MAG TPA: serine O-acetyltransferase, partial [Methylocella sp.]|nr:serine O-acetyltransferase [Methylocella sp.]
MVSPEGAAKVVALARADPMFARLRAEAEEAVRLEPDIAGFIFSSILNQSSVEAAVVHRLATRLGHQACPADLIEQTYIEVIAGDPSIPEAFRADIAAVVDRDPACTRLIEPVLYFKGFHAIETHRLAHALWNAGRKDFALYLQSRSSEVFQTDIHPAARIGKGIFLDHATGLVVGATAVIGDNVSMLQDVTLGGTGKERGDRHPKVKQGVMIGAGAKILGN